MTVAESHPRAVAAIRSVRLGPLARELKRTDLRYGIASACVDGGQGIAMPIENTRANGGH